VEETTLIVDLTEDADVDTVNVIDPDGELYRRLAVYRGVTRLSTEIDEAYTPGVYEILGVRQSENVSSTQLEIAPELAITDISLKADGRIKFPEKLGRTGSSEVAVTIRNSGSGPAFIRKLLVLGDVPNPTFELLDDSVDRSGMFDLGSNRFYSDGVTVAKESSITVFSDTLPFSYVGEGWDCSEAPQQGRVEVTIRTRQADYAASSTRILRYSATDSDGSCTVEIGPEVSDA
jgi:hypothetical protein